MAVLNRLIFIKLFPFYKLKLALLTIQTSLKNCFLKSLTESPVHFRGWGVGSSHNEILSFPRQYINRNIPGCKKCDDGCEMKLPECSFHIVASHCATLNQINDER